ncbi:glycosyltransferase [Vibrio tubiashii]|uniref:glycosyltransferase n=1 Tax=Vibrio tubiashii TaxID=29498 RepID=UPI001EFE4B1E|nr:glycosyltransferase [Vibrio tubiashii]MCG9579475.1 glycosyltransferase [Vibrio tubiashii]
MSKYLVIASPSIGGAERRFFDIFKSMSKNKEDIYLVAPNLLLQKLDNSYKLNEKIISIELTRWSYVLFCFKFYFGVVCKSSKDDTFHYPLNPPFFLHYFPIRKYSISYCYCYAKPKISLKSIGLSLQRIAGVFASKIDVLSPAVYDEVKKSDKKFSLTPGGSFVDAANFNTNGKKNDVAIISRLEHGKGIDTYIKIVEMLKSAELDLELPLPKFRIYGEGSMKSWVEKEVSHLSNKGVEITYHGFATPQQILSESGIVFSLQTTTNYPSRVVAESLLSGSQVIVLDSGDTQEFGQVVGLHYLNEDLSNLVEVFNAVSIEKISTGLKKDISERAKVKFNSPSYLEYYKRVME